MKKIIITYIILFSHLSFGQSLNISSDAAIVEVPAGKFGLIHKSGTNSVSMKNTAGFLVAELSGVPNLNLGVNDGPARIKLNNGIIENTGYTAFGSDAPFIKTKKLTGVTAGAVGSSVSSTVAHGVNPQKILAISLFVQYTEGGQLYLNPEDVNTTGDSATYLLSGPNIIVLNKPGVLSIINTPFVLYITYEE